MVISISIQTWYSYLGYLGYQNSLCLPKVADRIYVKEPIIDEIFGDCMKRRQQKKPSYKPMLKLNKYLYYKQCDLGDPYPISKKDNQFYLGVQYGATGAYYA